MATYTISFTDADGTRHKLAQTDDSAVADDMVKRFGRIYPKVSKSTS